MPLQGERVLDFREMWLGTLLRKTNSESKQGAAPSLSPTSSLTSNSWQSQDMENSGLSVRFQHCKVDYRKVSLRLRDHSINNFTGNYLEILKIHAVIHGFLMFTVFKV